MPAYAPVALGIAVALSAIGAVALCVLIMLYGFTPAGEEPPGETSRRLLATRIGHALAAVCFAGTATLIAIVLVGPVALLTPAPAAVSIPAPAATVPETVADERIPELGAKVDGQETRLSEAEARMQRLERELRERATATPPAPVAAPTPAPTPPPASAPAHRRVTPKANATTSSAAPAHAPATTTTRVAATPPVEKSSPTASALPAAPSSSAPAASPLTEVSTPAAASSSVAAPANPPASIPAPAPPPAVTAAAPASTPAASTPARPARPQHFDLRTKLREDWRAIRRGVDSAPDDFRRAVEETKRSFGIGD